MTSLRCPRILAIVVIAAVPAAASGEPPRAPAKTAARGPIAKRAGPVPASKAWHTPTPGKTAPVDDAGRPKLVLQALNTTDRVELAARGERGGFSAEDLDRAAHALREPSSGNEHPIDPHLLDLVYRIEMRFGAQEVRVISGYRTPHHGSTSNHCKGRAMDLVVPGTSDEEVARFAREQGFVGVGVYPVSGFVHLDVREHSFFWIDSSGPGKRNRTRGLLPDLALRSDTAAAQRGERSVGPFHVGGDVDAALALTRSEDRALALTRSEDRALAPSAALASAAASEDDDVDVIAAP